MTVSDCLDQSGPYREHDMTESQTTPFTVLHTTGHIATATDQGSTERDRDSHMDDGQMD